MRGGGLSLARTRRGEEGEVSGFSPEGGPGCEPARRPARLCVRVLCVGTARGPPRGIEFEKVRKNRGADRAAAGASEEKPWVTRPQTKWHLRRVPANTPWASLGHGCRGASQAGRWEAGDRHGKMYPSLFEPFAFSVKSPYYIFKKHFDFYYY